MTQNANNLCWLDMEMTGLDPERERIIEIAMIITDSDLNVLAQSELFRSHILYNPPLSHSKGRLK